MGKRAINDIDKFEHALKDVYYGKYDTSQLEDICKGDPRLTSEFGAKKNAIKREQKTNTNKIRAKAKDEKRSFLEALHNLFH